MIPSTAPPFGMTRWVAQTRENYVSMTPYNVSDTHIHGFQGTHQPAIWMGESGQVAVIPGAGHVRSKFQERGMKFERSSEVRTPSYYRVEMDAVEGGKIIAEQSASATSTYVALRLHPDGLLQLLVWGTFALPSPTHQHLMSSSK